MLYKIVAITIILLMLSFAFIGITRLHVKSQELSSIFSDHNCTAILEEFENDGTTQIEDEVGIAYLNLLESMNITENRNTTSINKLQIDWGEAF